MYTVGKKIKSLSFAVLMLFFITFGLFGCNGDGSTGEVDTEGDVIVSLTDAPGDFSSYTVDVLSLNLKKANGAEVAVLPLSARVDFAQYTEMTEFLTAATVPSGVYISATMVLDYQDADIWVEGEDGSSIQVTNIVDENGEDITTLEISVQLEDLNRLVIAQGVPAHLMLDFDLQASNHVDSDAVSPTLTVEPFLVADVDVANGNKLHRLRGLLDDVNIDENSFSVILRPFFCALAETHKHYGMRSVTITDETLFDINNVAYEGTEGLTAMDGLDQYTPVVAIGNLKFEPLRFEATEVYAGSSVPGANLDVVTGWVTQRSGDTLTVKGASMIRNGSTFYFHNNVSLIVSDETTVTRQLSTEEYNKDDISIGQRITAFGIVTGDAVAAGEILELDASEGYVRMMLTTVRGTVVSVDENDPVAQLDLDLQSIGIYRAGIFDFTGTGTSPEDDADPENYEIYTGTMNLDGIYDTPLKVRGFVEPFGMAPADFSAYTLIDVTALKAYIKINWLPETALPFTEISPDNLELNLEGVGRLHHLVRGHVATDLLDLEAVPKLVPAEDGEGVYVLRYGGTIEIHLVYEDFTASIEELLEEGYLARKCHSLGQFDGETSTLTTKAITIWFRLPVE